MKKRIYKGLLTFLQQFYVYIVYTIYTLYKSNLLLCNIVYNCVSLCYIFVTGQNRNTPKKPTPPEQVAKLCKDMSTLDFSPKFNTFLIGYEKSVERVKSDSDMKRTFRIYDGVCDVIKFVDKEFAKLNTREQMEVSAKLDFITELLEIKITENEDTIREKGSFKDRIGFSLLKRALSKLKKASDKYDKLTYPDRNTLDDQEYVAELKELYANAPTK